MKQIKPLSLLLFLLINCSLSAQKLTKVKEKVEEPFEHVLKYQVLKSDPTVKHGYYRVIKGLKILEEGSYKNGKKLAAWTVFDFEVNRPKLAYDSNSGDLISYALGEHDYDCSIPAGILSNVGNVYNLDRPIILKTGKATVFYAIQHAIERKFTKDEKLEKGNAVLQWLVSTDGQLSEFSIVEASSNKLRTQMLDALLEIQDIIECYPATKNTKEIDAYYNLTIEFNL